MAQARPTSDRIVSLCPLGSPLLVPHDRLLQLPDHDAVLPAREALVQHLVAGEADPQHIGELDAVDAMLAHGAILEIDLKLSCVRSWGDDENDIIVPIGFGVGPGGSLENRVERLAHGEVLSGPLLEPMETTNP